MNALSVVIPTYNRCEILREAISAYLVQTALNDIAEILVVDDGSTDSTGEVVASFSKTSTVPIRYLRQENKGPAAARNVGIREVSSELLLFSDDDMIATPNLVAEHLEWHRKCSDWSIAILGQAVWSPKVRPTPFMQWYGSDGVLFSYSNFAG